jgi:hypothetical protein
MLIVQQLGSALFFFSPGLAWIVRQLELEREVACDDWVVNEQADAAPYASCLVRLAEGTPWPHRALAAPGAFVTRRSMSIRIERILQRTRGMRMKPARGPMAVTLVAMLALVFLAVTVAPTIAYSDECDGQPAHAYSAYTGSGLTLPGLTLQPYGPATHASAAQVHGAPVHAASVQPQPSKVTAPRDVQPAASRVAVRTSTVQGTDVQTQTRYSVTQRQALYAPILIAAASPAAGDYIDAIQSALGQRLTPEQLIELKSVDVTPQDVHAWHAAGYPAIRVRDLVAAKSVGLSPATFASLKSAFGTVTFDDAIAAQSMGVDTQYRSQLSAAGLKDLTLRMLVSLKSLDVTPAYVSQANALGFGTLTASQIEELKAMNIDAAYVQRVRSHGFNDLTLRQIVELKASGVIK